MKKFDYFFYLAFILIIVLLSWKIYDLKNLNQNLMAQSNLLISKNGATSSSNNDVDSALKMMPDFAIPYVNKKGVEIFSFSKTKTDKYYLFIFFTPYDCYSCFDEIPLWNKIGSQFKQQIDVVGVTTGANINQLQYFVEQQGIKVPVIYDENGILFSELKLLDSGSTPIKIFTTTNGAILNTSRSTYDNKAKQNAYVELLNKIIQ